jgi:hypothetical protein
MSGKLKNLILTIVSFQRIVEYVEPGPVEPLVNVDEIESELPGDHLGPKQLETLRHAVQVLERTLVVLKKKKLQSLKI